MKNTLTGFIMALALCSVALNVAQYKGKLTSPQLVQMVSTDKMAYLMGE